MRKNPNVWNRCRPISLLFLTLAALPGPPALAAFTRPQEAQRPCIADLKTRDLDSESLRNESELGHLLSKDVERFSKIVKDSTATEYINRLAQSLARHSDVPFPIRIQIIDSSVGNELILPGGLVYISDKLILQAENESELGLALAYAVAYSALRCGTRQVTPGQFTQLDSTPTMILLPPVAAGYTGAGGADVAFPLREYFKQQREFVLAVDSVGLRYLYEAGYDPEYSLRLLERISRQYAERRKNAQNVPSVFLALRLESMRKEIVTGFPSRDEAIISTSEFDRVKERLSLRKLTASLPMLPPPPPVNKPACGVPD